MSDVDAKGEEIAKGMQPPKSQEEHRARIEKQMIQQAKDADLLFSQTGVEVEVLDASIEALDLTKNEEGGEKMLAAVEAAMKKFNIKPPGPPPGAPKGMSAPQMLMQNSSQGSGAKRSSSPYKQRRF